MLILFDHGAPKSLARAVPGHTVITRGPHGAVPGDGVLVGGATLEEEQEDGVQRGDRELSRGAHAGREHIRAAMHAVRS